MLFNGKKINTYDIDTIDTVEERAMSQFDAIEKYTVIVPPLTDLSPGTYTLSNFISKIKLFDSYSIVEFLSLNSIEEKRKVDIIILFISLKHELISRPEIQLYFETELETIPAAAEINMREILKEAPDFLKYLAAAIKDLRARARDFEKIAAAFEKSAQVPISDIDTDKIVLKAKLRAPADVDMDDLFNAGLVSNFAPLLIYKNFYKYDAVPVLFPKEQLDTNSIYCYVYNFREQKKHRKLMPANYSRAQIYKDNKDRFIIEIEYEGDMSSKEVIERILKHFKFDIEILKITTDSVYGNLYAPDINMNVYIMTDLILTNAVFSHFFTSNENNFSPARVSLKFSGDKKMNIILSPHVLLRTSRARAKLFNVPIGTPYLQIRIKYKKRTNLVPLSIIFSKLLAIYKKIAPATIANYEKIYPGFSDQYTTSYAPISISNKQLKDVEPDVFVSGYGKACQPARAHPTIITEEEAADTKEDILRFPNTENGRLYTCKNPEYSHVGVIRNKLENKNKYPFLPCCFLVNQEKRKIYKDFLKDSNEKEEGLEGSVYIIQTNKQLDKNIVGRLPFFIHTSLSVSIPDMNFFRIGVQKSRLSFLECVYKCIEQSMDSRPRDFFENLLVEISKNPRACMEQAYDMTEEQISIELTDKQSYIDPSLYYRLLEKYFNCRILLFTRTSEYPEGDILVPRFKHFLTKIKYEPGIPLILIYEHTGTSLNDSPRCEIIANMHNNEIRDMFFSEDEMAIFLKMYENKILSYNNNIKIAPVQFDLPFTSQYIDINGKCAAVRYKNITLHINPIYPLTVKLFNRKYLDEIYKLSQLREIFGKQNLTINGNIAKVTVFGIEGKIFIDEQECSSLFGMRAAESALVKINNFEKQSRCAGEFVLYLLSSFARVAGAGQIDNDLVDLFVRKYISVDYNFAPGVPISNKIRYLAKIFRKRNKFIVSSDNEKQLLLEFIENNIYQRMHEIQEYYKKDKIYNYYKNPEDFDPGDFIIVSSWENYMYRINFKDISRAEIFDYPRHGFTLYYFQNNLIDKQIYIAQTSESLDRAIDVSKDWIKTGANSFYLEGEIDADFEDLFDEDLQFTFFSFEGIDKVNKYLVAGEDNDYDIKIIGYRFEGNDYFISLLK